MGGYRSSFQAFHDDKYRLFVTTPKGFEDILCDEITECLAKLDIHSASEPQAGTAGAFVVGRIDTVVALNFYLSCASRVLWVVGEGQAQGLDSIFECAMKINWPQFFDVDKTFAVSATVAHSGVTNSMSAALKVKDAICDVFREKCEGKRPNVDAHNPQVHIMVRLHDDQLSISIDTSGEPLSRRHYRKSSGEAPLSEVLAACLLRTSGWNRLVEAVWSNEGPAFFERAAEPTPELPPGPAFRAEAEAALAEQQALKPDAAPARKIPLQVMLSPYFIDPMCGTGTLPIEAALALLCRKPNARREEFAYVQLRAFEEVSPLFERFRKRVIGLEKSLVDAIAGCEEYAARCGISVSPQAGFEPLRGYDHNPRAIESAKTNALEAGVSRLIKFVKVEIANTKPHASCGMIVVNPPYGERVGSAGIDMDELYEQVGNTWKHHFPNWSAWLLSGNLAAVKKIGLRPTRKVSVYNGNIECRFLQFVLYPFSGKKELKRNSQI